MFHNRPGGGKASLAIYFLKGKLDSGRELLMEKQDCKSAERSKFISLFIMYLEKKKPNFGFETN
jgi:hypothetical protein